MVTIAGGPGMGKSSPLAKVVRLAERFHVLDVGGEETAFHEPYSLLRPDEGLVADAAVLRGDGELAVLKAGSGGARA
ncbi:hypothetical protein AB0K00_40405 [Dactylosporangium sp. NPDC049525]|uniref:hypothetical protein n=1 Tax=Dactylosporangium sp. NPDC049525 TaxID=3154730 RepID=UPI00342DFEE6